MEYAWVTGFIPVAEWGALFKLYGAGVYEGLDPQVDFMSYLIKSQLIPESQEILKTETDQTT